MTSTVKKAIFSLIIVIAAFAGVIGGRIIEQHNYNNRLKQLSSLFGSTSSSDKVSATLDFIEENYVDSISRDSLVEALMPHIFEQLDPHSTYIPAQDLQDVTESLEGEFDGVGISFNMATDTVIIINVIPSGPSEKAGILGGDRIIEINDSLVAGQKVLQTDVMKMLRGKRGSTVKLGIERQGASELFDVDVERDVIAINSIQSSMILRDSIGYIKMLQFARTTHSEILAAVEKLEEQGLKSLIIDLRGNSGGYLDQAIYIVNELLPKDELIVYTEDRNGDQQREYSDGSGKITDIRLAVLIDEGSASSSEILAGAVQDNDRGTIIGRRSFGKGLVQQQVPFVDGSAMRVTVARYYTPTGRSIQKSYTMGESDEDYYDEMLNRYALGELFVADSIHFADSLKKVTPKGKVVYGGGGIMPDVFVPADTTNMTSYFMEVSARNILYNFTTKYADSHRERVNSVTSFEDLDDFLESGDLLNEFVSYASSRGVKAKWADINRSRDIIEAQLKAYIGRNTPLEDDAFYHSIYPIDVVILKAIEVLEEQEAEQTEEEL